MSRGGGGGRQQLEALSQQIEELEEVEEELKRQIDALETEKAEIDEAIEGLNSLETGSIVQVPVGGDAHVRAEIQSIEEVVVDVGADYAVEQPSDDAVDILKTKKDTIDDRIEEAESEIADVEEERSGLEQRAQQSQQQLLQQQMQQRQQGE